MMGGDAALLAGSRPLRRFTGKESLLSTAGAPAEVHLFLEGTARLFAETHFGPFQVAALPAPALADLTRALGGVPGLCRIVPEAGSRSAVFGFPDVRRLLLTPDVGGAAFRRLSLSSLATALRETNSSLGRFFEAGPPPTPPPPARPVSGVEHHPFDPAAARDLLEATGIDPGILPRLGLTARRVMPGVALVTTGDEGDEAYLIAEGRLRVSVQISGAGEEALAILGPGEVVGEMALVDDAPRSADVIAHGGPALVYVLPRETFRRFLQTGDPAGAPLLGGVAIALARRLEEAIRKAAGFRILAGPG
jgi:CRP/FNR family cyclic AMP-dependent transcriptional regulator